MTVCFHRFFSAIFISCCSFTMLVACWPTFESNLSTVAVAVLTYTVKSLTSTLTAVYPCLDQVFDHHVTYLGVRYEIQLDVSLQYLVSL
jgi:hypothetical protein